MVFFLLKINQINMINLNFNQVDVINFNFNLIVIFEVFRELI